MGRCARCGGPTPGGVQGEICPVCRQKERLQNDSGSKKNNSESGYKPYRYTGPVSSARSESNSSSGYIAPTQQRNGYYSITYKDGCTYTGYFADNKRHGKGKYTRPDGAFYDGEWKNDVRHGCGIESFPDNSRFEGTFVNDKKHGKGIRTYQSGRAFDEEWDNGTKISEHELSKSEIDKMVWQSCTKLKNEELNEYLELHHDIIVPDGVTKIPDYQFAKCTNLKSVHFPEGLKEIGYAAFRECKNINVVDLPDSVEKIGKFAFSNCSGITEILLPDNIAVGNCALMCGRETTGLKIVFKSGSPKEIVLEDGCLTLCAKKLSPENRAEIEKLNPKAFKSKNCYIASCVYGSYDCPEVWTLRRFRDYTLEATWYGRAFISVYYAISPTLVKWFGETKWFNAVCKKPLDRMVRKLLKKGYTDTLYRD